MTNTRLRLTPSEFGALWTYLKTATTAQISHRMGFMPCGRVDRFIEENDIELIEEHNPDFRPRYENGTLTVDPLFRMWVSTLDSPATQRLLGAIQ